MPTLYNYRIFCITEGTYRFIWSEEPPTQCPYNSSDTIDPTSITIVGVQNPNVVQIKEEIVPTGGHYTIVQMKVNALQNSTSSTSLWFPFPISPLNLRFSPSNDMIGDSISLSVGKDGAIGIITENITPAAAWISQNYLVGDRVTYAHPKYGNRVYTCILDTVSNESPINPTYWKHGYRVQVSSTVFAITALGYYISLYDGVNKDDGGRILDIDETNSYIWLETNLVNAFSTGTAVLQTVYIAKDYEIYDTGIHLVGAAKIGASYVPTDVLITIDYTNTSSSDKIFIGDAEILY